MRILFITQLLPLPLDAGPKIRSYYVLRYLADAGHEVTLACMIRPGDREEDMQSLRRICRSVHVVPLTRSRFKDIRHCAHSLFSATPFLILRDHVAEMRRKLDGIAATGSFDALHADQLWMAPYGVRCAGPELKVLDQHNAVFRIPLQLAEHQHNPLARLFLRMEAAKLAAFERHTCDLFDKVVWVTEEDRKAVGSHDHGNSDRHQIIPIATDPEERSLVKRQRPFRVTFLGGMHWPPNAEGITWFAERVWPKVADAVPDAVLTLIGKGIPRKLLRVESKGRLEAAGYVSDLKPYLAETAASIVPLRTGAGMRVKILDAWCWGLPVVSTSIGAEGMHAVHGENLLIGDEPGAFAECLIRVLQDRKLAQRLSDNGRATVESSYDWRQIYRAWDRIYC